MAGIMYSVGQVKRSLKISSSDAGGMVNIVAKAS